jgi:hypothetical protein
LINPGEDSRPGGPFQFFLEQERIEVVRISMTELRSLVSSISRELSGDQRINVPQDRLRLLSRVAYGCVAAGPVLDPEFDALLLKLCHRTAIRRSDESARHHALVAVLAREQGDDLVASWNARGGLDAVLQAALLRAGQPYAGSKWIYEQLRATSDGAAMWPLLGLPATDDGQQAYIDACLAEVNRSLGLAISLRELGRHARWDVTGLQSVRLGSAEVLLQEAHSVVTELALSEPEAWAQLSGSRAGEPIGTEARAVRDLAWRLYLRGLAGIRWIRGMTA